MHRLRHLAAITLMPGPGGATETPGLSCRDDRESQRRYHRAALATVAAMLDAIVPGVGALLVAIIAVRGERRGVNQRGIAPEALATALAIDRAALLRRLLALDQRCQTALSLLLVDRGWRRQLPVEDAPTVDRGAGADAAAPGAGADGDSPSPQEEIMLSEELVDLLDVPHPPAAASIPAPVLDGDGRRDLATLTTLLRSARGTHLALRRSHAAREVGDIAALVAEAGSPLLVIEATVDALPLALLRAELHAGTMPPLVLVALDHLTEPASDRDAYDDESHEAPAVTGKLAARQPLPPAVLDAMRGTVLWSVPAEGDLPQAGLPWLAACLGPLRHDSAWARGIIAEALGPSVGDPATSPAVRALARRLADPRDGAAIAVAATTLATQGTTSLDEAAARLCASFSDHPDAQQHLPRRFDPALLVCDADALQLLDRAELAAARGARVLAHGPPGGGKSAYARELALRMARGGPVRMVTPADFLARGWGAMEKRVRALWRRAAAEGEVLVIDEFESVCSRRVAGDTGNNAMLTRTLTDEWLRAFDDHPGVPLLATTNEVATVDPAIKRRCAFVLAFGDVLSPMQERLAWRRLLEREPPPGWRPCGAAVADVTLASERCRMLGLDDGASLQAAIVAARAERTGIAQHVAVRLEKGQTRHLHGRSRPLSCAHGPARRRDDERDPRRWPEERRSGPRRAREEDDQPVSPAVGGAGRGPGRRGGTGGWER